LPIIQILILVGVTQSVRSGNESVLPQREHEQEDSQEDSQANSSAAFWIHFALRRCCQQSDRDGWCNDQSVGRASALHWQAPEIGRQIGEATVTALALTGLARIALRSNQICEARRLCREALAASECVDDLLGRAHPSPVWRLQRADRTRRLRGFKPAPPSPAEEARDEPIRGCPYHPLMTRDRRVRPCDP
jgi:hypothetical protein